MEKFNKESLTVEEQLDLLIKRNLIVNNYDSAISILKRIGYYHLSSYMRLFQEGDNHKFSDNVSFNQLHDLYKFDQDLRHITFKAIEKIEIAYRVAISNYMCKNFGSHWFYNKECFRKDEDLEKSLEIIKKEIKKKDDEYAETFIANYYKKYSEPDLPPFWMVAETLTIGSLNRLYQMLDWNSKREIVKYLGFQENIKIISSSNWLFALSVIRNICAHHSRLFNRIFRIAPTVPDKILEFKNAFNNRFYYISMVINFYLITISNDNSFENDLKKLFDEYKNIDITKLGFPKDWETFSITNIKKVKL